MHDLHVLMVGLSEAQIRRCENILRPLFPGLTITLFSTGENWLTSLSEERFNLILAACEKKDIQSIISLGLNRFSAGLALIGLVETFDPAWVNWLLSAGMDRVVPWDRLENLLPECIPPRQKENPQGQHSVAERSDNFSAVSAHMKLQMQQLLGFQNLFEEVFLNVPAMLVVLDLQGRVIFFNRRSEDVSGYTSAEVQGRLIEDMFLLPDEKKGVQEVFERLKKGEFPIEHQNAWLTKEGDTRQIQWSNTVTLLEPSRNVIFIVGMGQDITDEVNRISELRELGSRFERLFHASPVGIGLVRFKDMIVIDANESLLRMVGKESDRFIGLPADQTGLFPEQGTRELLDLVARHGPINDREWCVQTKKQKMVWFIVSFEMIEWASELAILVMVRDISERVKAEEKIRHLNKDLEQRILERSQALEASNREKQAEVETRKVFETSSQRLTQIIWDLPDVIAMNEPGGRMLYVNKAGRKLFDLSETESVSHINVFGVYPPDILERVKNEVAPQARANGTWKGELELLLPNGKRIPISQTILAHHNQNGEIVFFSTIIRDITEEKQVADNIKLALEKEKEMGLLRVSFFSMASHQFRTPLSTILSSAELLEHYASQWDEEKRTLHLRRIEEQAQLLNSMLNDILDVGRLELKIDEIEFGIVDACEIVNRCVKTFSIVDGGAHQFKLDCVMGRLPIRSSPHLIDRIVENLLSNAVKFSPVGTLVDVEAYPKDQWVVIEVQDKGIGIPASDIPMLYQPFFRGSNSSAISGSGLGLMIVKRSLERIGGEIHIESRVNEGTWVQVRIPLESERE